MANKHDNKTTNIILFVLVGIAILLGATGHAYNNETSVDPQITANIATLISHEQRLGDLKQASDVSWDDIETLEKQYMAVLTEGETYLTVEDLAVLKARVLVAENAITTLSENRNSVPNQGSTTTDFNLVLWNLDSIVQDTYSEGDIIYITGDAGVSNTQTLSMKIRTPSNEIIVDKGFSIPQDGRFTSVFVVPALSDTGTYTITVSGGSIVESIKFELQ